MLFSAELKNVGISEYNEFIRNLLTLLKDLEILRIHFCQVDKKQRLRMHRILIETKIYITIDMMSQTTKNEDYLKTK